MVMQCSHSIKRFFRGGRGDFVVVIEVCGTWIEATETYVMEEIVGSGGCGIVGKF